MKTATRGARGIVRMGCRGLSMLGWAVAVLAAAAEVVGLPDAHAAPASGPAEIVTPGDGLPASRLPISVGSRSTPFSLRLPAGAACSGDSVTGLYRVQSFMVPADTDPASLTFGPFGPEPTSTGARFRQPLWQTDGNPYVEAGTAPADSPGKPGTIINIPAFTFAVFEAAGDLPAGAYLVGIACTKGPPSSTQLDKFWTARLEVTSGSNRDETWKVPASAPPGPGTATENAGGGATSPAIPPAAAEREAPKDGVGVLAEVGADAAAPGPAGNGATGGPPTLGLPVFEALRHVSIADNRTASILLWLTVALVTGRIALLLARPSAAVRATP